MEDFLEILDSSESVDEAPYSYESNKKPYRYIRTYISGNDTTISEDKKAE